MSNRGFKISITCLSLTAHLGAGLQFLFDKSTSSLPPGWTAQFYVLLTLSAALGLAVFMSKGRVLVVLLAARLGVVFLMAAPFGEEVGVELALLVSIILEAFAFCPLGVGIAFSVACLATSTVLTLPLDAWGQAVAPATAVNLVQLLIYQGIVIALMIIARLHHDNQVPQKNLNTMLDEATLALAENNLKLQEYAAFSEKLGAEVERKRVAREIHDTLAYAMTNLIMMMEAALSLTAESEAELREILGEAHLQSKQGLGEIRRAVRALRSVDERPLGGLKAVHSLVRAFAKATRQKIEIHLGDAPWTFGDEADRIVYRLVQECITNSVRHGRAEQISVYFSRVGNGVSVTVKDNGLGASRTDGGYGLVGMRERLESIEGTLEVSSRPGAGFRVSAWVPLREVRDAENQSAVG